MNNKLDFKKIKKVYLIGIKGSGMVALVELFQKLGLEVTGSDVKEKFFTDQVLKDLDVTYHEGFSVENIKKENSKKKIDLVVYSTGYNEKTNEELAWIKKENFPSLSYPEAIGMYMREKFSIAVCGTHGKTTTTAMAAIAMKEAGADPTAIIGSKVKQFNSNLLFGRSKYFVLEADEYQNKLKYYNPTVVVLTSVDYDHPDFFKTFEDYKQAFRDFIEKIPAEGFLVAWGEDENVLDVVKSSKCNVVLYGDFSDMSKAEKLRERIEKSNYKTELFLIPEELKLKIPGKHNILNATAVTAVCQKLGLSKERAVQALNSFEGTFRRFDLLGECNGALVIDDYAHHPREVEVTLRAAREKYPDKNIVCIFHPHTFTRTKAFLKEFGSVFKDADEVIILDIYGSAREQQGTIKTEALVSEIAKSHRNVSYLGNFDVVYNDLIKRIGKDDIIITMGAGNVCDLGKRLVDKK